MGQTGSAHASPPPSGHDFTFTSIDGEPLPLSRFKGKAMLIVNTASECGFTSQYAGLQTVWERYRDRGSSSSVCRQTISAARNRDRKLRSSRSAPSTSTSISR